MKVVGPYRGMSGVFQIVFESGKGVRSRANSGQSLFFTATYQKLDKVGSERQQLGSYSCQSRWYSRSTTCWVPLPKTRQLSRAIITLLRRGLKHDCDSKYSLIMRGLYFSSTYNCKYIDSDWGFHHLSLVGLLDLRILDSNNWSSWPIAVYRKRRLLFTLDENLSPHPSYRNGLSRRKLSFESHRQKLGEEAYLFFRLSKNCLHSRSMKGRCQDFQEGQRPT